MRLPPLPPATAAILERRLGAAGREWAGTVTGRAAGYVRRWGLEPEDEALTGGTWSYLLSARTRAGTACVLKLSRHLGHVRREAAALRWWGPLATVVELLAADEGGGALLLERVLPGSHHRPAGPETLVPVLRALATAPPGGPARRVSQGAVVEEIVSVTRRRLAGDARVPPARMARTEARVRGLLASSDPSRHRLLHGDLSPGNVLEGDPGLRLIDPAGLFGEPEFEVAGAAVYFSRRPAPGIAGALARSLGLDARRAEGWARLHTAHSAGYVAAFGGDEAWLAACLDVALT